MIVSFKDRATEDIFNGINSKATHPFKLRRTKIEFGDDFKTFKRILKGALDIWVVVDYLGGYFQNKGEVDLS